ncbi:MAG: hypothetical protein ACT4P7_12495 [Gemmatimonadaceae bacterium]
MAHHRDLSRREFTSRAALGALATATFPTDWQVRCGPSLAGAPDWPGYDRAYVLDLLATPGPFNVPDWLGKPLTPAMVENARGSGITAVNSTVHAMGATAEMRRETGDRGSLM